MNNILQEINQGKGYTSLPKIDQNIHQTISQNIESTLKDLLKQNNIFYYQDTESLYEVYKFISNKKWINLFNKKTRTLRKEFSLPISKYFSSYLENILNSRIEISDDLMQGFPTLSFRIVRPSQIRDVGSLHADQWFIDIGVQPKRNLNLKSQLIKFWMPINVEHQTSNLLIIPDSQKNKDKYKYHVVDTKNGSKPIIKNDVPKEEIFMIKNKNGVPVIFNMNLIHGGALNKSKECRVSIEFEFFASDNQLQF